MDLSLYLVTGRELLPPGKVRAITDIVHSLLNSPTARHIQNPWKRSPPSFSGEIHFSLALKALQGGVTVVQIREKKADTLQVRTRACSSLHFLFSSWLVLVFGNCATVEDSMHEIQGSSHHQR